MVTSVSVTVPVPTGICMVRGHCHQSTPQGEDPGNYLRKEPSPCDESDIGDDDRCQARVNRVEGPHRRRVQMTTWLRSIRRLPSSSTWTDRKCVAHEMHGS